MTGDSWLVHRKLGQVSVQPSGMGSCRAHVVRIEDGAFQSEESVEEVTAQQQLFWQQLFCYLLMERLENILEQLCMAAVLHGPDLLAE